MALFPQPGQGFNQNTLNDVLGTVSGVSSLFSGAILRDYNHAAKVFRTNSYENAPKLKFLFHVYFDFNFEIGVENNLGLIVKEIKLPNYTFNTSQMNQYNRKRIVQTKIKYDPIEVTFHDDGGNMSTKIWEAYYKYNYGDANSIGSQVAGPGRVSSINNYNNRNLYNQSLSNDMGYGYSGGEGGFGAGPGKKQPFFKKITVFGLNQHNFTAYSLINPVITSFGHDQYSYSEGQGVMSNRMTIDYETVVYDYGALDGRSPGNIVKGFGNPSHYDTLPSPIAGIGRGTILGQGGLLDAAGGAIEALQNGNIVGAIAGGLSVYDSFKQVQRNPDITGEMLNGMLRTTLGNTPEARNARFNIPIAQSSPGFAGLAGGLIVGASVLQDLIDQNSDETVYTGQQVSGAGPTDPIFLPVPIND
jgi:hypothetical protein